MLELVIAIAITAIIGLMVLTVFSAQAESYRRQEDLSKTQQNLRLAMEVVSRDLAMAGFGFSATGEAWGALSSWDSDEEQPLAALYLIQNWSGDGSDAVEIAYMDPDSEQWATAFASVPPPCNTDEIQFDEKDREVAGNFDAGDYLVCYDPGFRAGARAFVWAVRASGDPASGIVPVTAGNQADFVAHCDDASGNGLSREMTCAELVRVAYYIDNDDSDGMGPGSPAQPVLMLSFSSSWPTTKDVPIALGIEDMQFDLCMVGNDCRTTGLYQNDYDSIDTRAVGFIQLQSVTIRMMSRSLRTDIVNSAVSRKVDLSNDPLDTSNPEPDGYHRRVASTEVLLRNAQAAWQMSQTY